MSSQWSVAHNVDAAPINEIKANVAGERHKNSLLEDSLSELQISIEELMRRVDQADDESNEWRTRFENQLELNEYLQAQSQNLTQKIEEAREAIKEIRATGSSKVFAKLEPDFLRGLERNRNVLQKQLRNLEMRLDQESKAYHRSNEERKNLAMELNSTKKSTEQQKKPVFSTNLSPDFKGSQNKNLRKQNII